jgi:hypothetical protein
VAAGLVPEAAAASARLEDVSRSHQVTRVTLPGVGSWVVKTPARAGQGRRLDPELFVYRMASWQPDLATVLPPARLVDERRQVLVMDAIDRVEPGGPASPELAIALGRAVGTWQRATRATAIPFMASAGALWLARTAPDAWGLANPAARALASSIVADEAFRRALDEGADRWRPACLVRGDLKWDNCLVDAAASPAPSVRVIDWELAGRGDPAWDVACAIADAVMLARWTEPQAALEPPPRAARDSVAAFGRGYGATAGPVAPETWQTAAVFTVARLVHLALEYTEAHGDGAAGSAALATEAAAVILARRGELAGLLDAAGAS